MNNVYSHLFGTKKEIWMKNNEHCTFIKKKFWLINIGHFFHYIVLYKFYIHLHAIFSFCFFFISCISLILPIELYCFRYLFLYFFFFLWHLFLPWNERALETCLWVMNKITLSSLNGPNMDFSAINNIFLSFSHVGSCLILVFVYLTQANWISIYLEFYMLPKKFATKKIVNIPSFTDCFSCN